MKRPIIQKLNRLIEKNAISMHVPGHKNMTIGYLNRLDLAMDMTEIFFQAEDGIRDPG